MEPLLEDVIENAASLSGNGGVQITTYKEITTVHYVHPTEGQIRSEDGPTVRQALYNAIEDMES